MRRLAVTLLFSAARAALDFESVLLTDEHTKAFPSVDFAKGEGKLTPAQCKAWPGGEDWPSDSEWNSLNATLAGGLLKPTPPSTVCYQGPNYNAAQCSYLLTNATNNDFWIEDPVTVLSPWLQGSTCMPALNATGNCTQGGFPVYVVNATTVRDIQAAVNFARNKNVRLIIKNTGHDFGGRSVGAGSLSIWTHNLDAFELIRGYKKGNYSGTAAHFGSGLQGWQLFNHMFLSNLTIVSTGARTIGANGGWMAGGGHGNLASFYGLAADQVLELHVVTADGRYLIADEEQNTDLFFALRGGGGSTYGVVTSVVVKTYPPTTLTTSLLSIACNPPPDTNARARFAPIDNNTNFINNTARFWDALSIYFRFKPTIVLAGGVDWDYLYPLGNNSYSFRTRITYPNTSTSTAEALLQPLYDSLTRAGFPFTLNRTELVPTPYAGTAITPVSPASNGLANTRYRSRLIPHANFASDSIFNATFAAIRHVTEDGGYVLHGLSIGPSPKAAGYPGVTAAVNPAWRDNVLHLAYMTVQPPNLTAQQAREEEERANGFLKPLREVTKGAGSYINEGDPGEPEWQQSFFGANYGRLLEVKRERDPWGVFWAQTTVGSEGWEVVSVDGYPRSQNGRLCRVKEGKGKGKGKGPGDKGE
ncbi:putative fad binding domain-protein [Podospora aff. communis PSN243]|uniref:Fad binding domain-protein n=1 Tax=Podospora aff. communis PSN243 TaxID=3040156 RepID=A0AAV9GSY5_9PEZI|nr:putative fad binding domain-protein [Podospora aff. communis PSN243]